jgi:hypothetical protein
LPSCAIDFTAAITMENTMVKSEPSWLEAFPKEHRRFLRKFGVPPDQNPRAPDFNRRLLALAEQGLRGMDLAIEADKLHDEVFGGALTRAANAAHFAELIEVNGAGEIEQLAFAVLDHDGEAMIGMIGTSDAPYVTRSVGFLADVLDAVGPNSVPVGFVDEPPPPCQLTADQLLDNRARIDSILRDLATASVRGRVAGTAAVVFNRRPALYRFVGDVPVRTFADLLRQLRDRVARGDRSVPPIKRKD